MLLSQDPFKKGEKIQKKKERKKEHLFMSSKPRTFGVTQKSFFNMLARTLFMCVVYDASHIYTAIKRQSRQKSFATYPESLSCGTMYANSIRVWGMLGMYVFLKCLNYTHDTHTKIVQFF